MRPVAMFPTNRVGLSTSDAIGQHIALNFRLVDVIAASRLSVDRTSNRDLTNGFYACYRLIRALCCAGLSLGSVSHLGPGLRKKKQPEARHAE